MRDELAGSRHLALTLALLLGTFLITHGYMRAGCLYLACLQIPAGAYGVATGQYGFVLMSLVGGVLYLRGWRRKEARELEKPRVLRRRAQQPQSFADGWLAGDADAGAAPWARMSSADARATGAPPAECSKRPAPRQ